MTSSCSALARKIAWPVNAQKPTAPQLQISVGYSDFDEFAKYLAKNIPTTCVCRYAHDIVTLTAGWCRDRDRQT
jgi:hypothetical protein